MNDLFIRNNETDYTVLSFLIKCMPNVKAGNLYSSVFFLIKYLWFM